MLFFHQGGRYSAPLRLQRYNINLPNSKYFRHLISHLENFTRSKMGIKPFIYGLSDAFSNREKK